ncbi:1202_t:CDS:1, partial [Rhizophagus irregularis]
MPKFILITLFLTFTLAWVTQSIPAINYLEHATEPAKEFFYFPSKVNRKLNECNYCP